jgi:hypothetical protein
MSKIPVSTIVPFGLRLQPELKRRLEESATATGRSLNGEISARLEHSFDGGARAVNADDLLMSMLPPDYLERMKASAEKRGINLFAELLVRLNMFETFTASEDTLGEFASRLVRAVATNMSVEEFAMIKGTHDPGEVAPPPPGKKAPKRK